jgi:hypothetical protein
MTVNSDDGEFDFAEVHKWWGREVGYLQRPLEKQEEEERVVELYIEQLTEQRHTGLIAVYVSKLK